jgi:uracil-DNA glycosylase family 4
MPTNLPEPLKTKLAARLSFYEDLGLAPFYRKRTLMVQRLVPTLKEQASRPQPFPKPTSPPALWGASRVGGSSSEPGTPKTPARPAQDSPKRPSPQDTATAPGASLPTSFAIAPQKNSNFFDLLERVENDSLLRIREDIGECTRCRLHKTRRHIVFADGHPQAQLVFVGEGPGADEDATGIPFVGRAGKLLTQMIQAMGLQREDVYICNVVKCRPPENRQPQPDEVATCGPYLVRQLEVVNPKVIVCLGATAAQTLLETTTGISKFRGQWQDFRGKKLLATYHPAYLLRNPAAKGEVWKDLQKVMAELGLAVKKGKSS